MGSNVLYIRSLRATVLMAAILLAGGCTSDLPDGMPAEGGFHPETFAQYDQHGYAFYQDTQACARCHGDNLDGGVAGVSCDSCHSRVTSDWKQDCTFCHGGRDNDTGAPPEGVKGETERSNAAVGAHTPHVMGSAAFRAFTCTECHPTAYTSYSDEGHIDGDGLANVTLGPLAGGSAAFDAEAATCSSVYCHGGKDVVWTSEGEMSCGSCHGSKADPEGLSGKHAAHLGALSCGHCHAAMVDTEGAFVDKTLHVDGSVSVKLVTGTFDPAAKTCTNSCHGEAAIAWEGDVHPDGWASPSQHPQAFYQDPARCKVCHGDNLTGGATADSCDACHTGGTDAWRTSCTFCHGGTDNDTGAPPESVTGATETSDPAVGDHTAHVTAADWHAAYDCGVCHPTYTSFDDPGHIDTNPGANVVFGDPAGGTAAFDTASATCSSVYCHGTGLAPSGDLSWTASETMDCNSCHAYDDAAQRSGFHYEHRYFSCDNCHGAVIDENDEFVDKALHINGQPDVELTVGTWDPVERSCANTCHSSVRPWGTNANGD